MISVRKRDGRVEAWSNDKLITSIGKSGVDIEMAEKVSGKIESWANEESSGVISSSEIRDKVIEELKLVDEAASDNYQVYKK
jgi:transcriptional regulator NrdR family protein